MRRERLILGQGLVEFALLLPIFLLMAMIILDLGRMAYYYSAVYNAAREGARYGAVHWVDTSSRENDTRNVARRLAAALEDDLIITPDFVDIDGDYKSDIVRVTVMYSFRTATPILPKLLGEATQSLSVSAQAIMRLEK